MTSAIVTRKLARTGCAGDPPDYPTYYYGVETDLRRRPENRGSMSISYAISGEADYLPANVRAKAQQLIDEWNQNKLPESHPRVQAWIADTYSYQAHCYRDTNAALVPFKYKRPDTVIYPLTRFWFAAYGFREFKDDPRFSDEWRTAEREAIRLHNQERMKIYESVCIPENHSAYLTVRRYYPDHQPRLDYISNPPQSPGHWYETGNQPAPEDCPGEPGIGKHPINGSWCQWCGWRKQAAE